MLKRLKSMSAGIQETRLHKTYIGFSGFHEEAGSRGICSIEKTTETVPTVVPRNFEYGYRRDVEFAETRFNC